MDFRNIFNTIAHFFKILPPILCPSFASHAGFPATYKSCCSLLPGLQMPHLSTYLPSAYTILLMTPTARSELDDFKLSHPTTGHLHQAIKNQPFLKT